MSQADQPPDRGPVVVTPATLKDLPLPTPGEGKDARGHVLVVAGTAATPGAAALAAVAALRAGAGKLTIMTCGTTASPLAVSVPEAMVLALPSTTSGHPSGLAVGEVAEQAAGADAVLLGCGWGDADETLAFLAPLLPQVETPVVLDAAATAYLGQDRDGLRHQAGRALLTANPRELALTAGCDVEDTARDAAGITADLARSTGVVVLCGGPDKQIAAPDGRRWVFTGGGPTLGVSGSGDVQAGVAVGLLARGADAARAAVWAAYLHGRAGERLAAEVGPVGSLAREQTAHIPQVLREIH